MTNTTEVSFHNSSNDDFKQLFREIKSEKVLDQIYIDVGAFDGDTVFKALAINKNLNVVAIEPIKELCDDIKNQLIMHHLEQEVKIAIINKACWNEKKVINFNEYSGWSKGLSTLRPIMTQIRPEGIFTDKINKYEVQADTLDNILTDNGVSNGVSVDFIKIDTEGSEEQVLKGFTLYHLGTRFHVESHIINLENILLQLLEMGSNIEKIYLSRDGNVGEHVIGTVIGEFIRDGSGLLKIPEKDKLTFPSGTDRIQFLIDKARECGGGGKGKILNIGCADNFMFRDIEDQYNLDVMNIDVKDEIPDSYKAKTKFKICDAHNLVGFNNKEFDCAILGDILEHVDDPVQVLKEAKRVSRNVYVTVPNEWEWNKELKPFENIAHIRFYTYGSLKKDLDKAFGFDNYYIKQYNGGGWSFFCIEHEGGKNEEAGLTITKGVLGGEKSKLNVALISTPFFSVPPKFYGGLEQVIWDLAIGLDKLGHNVTIFGPEGSKTPSHGKLIITGPSVDTTGVDWLQEERKRYEVYKDFINPEKYDLVHDHSWFGFPYLLKRKYPNLKILHSHHGGYSWDTYPPVGKANLVAISQFMKEYTIQHFKQKGYNIDCNFVRNGIDIDKYSLQTTKTDHLLFVGRLSQYKQPNVAIEVARRTNHKLDIIGGTFVDSVDYVKQLEKDIEKDPNISLWKDVSHEFKIEKMQNAKAILIPSKMNEPLNLVSLEGQACGTTVICSRDGGLPETIIQGKTGFVCNSIDEMVHNVKEHIQDIKPEDCRRNIEENFSIDIMAKNYEKLYRRILNGDEW